MSGDLARMHVLYQEGLQGMPLCWHWAPSSLKFTACSETLLGCQFSWAAWSDVALVCATRSPVVQQIATMCNQYPPIPLKHLRETY